MADPGKEDGEGQWVRAQMRTSPVMGRHLVWVKGRNLTRLLQIYTDRLNKLFHHEVGASVGSATSTRLAAVRSPSRCKNGKCRHD